MDALAHSEDLQKDAPLREDVRLLGRILGDTVRFQEGAEAFDVIEKLRQTALRFHRNADEAARQELQGTISRLPTEQAIRIIRAFGYFSHLANIAEARWRMPWRAPGQPGCRAGNCRHSLRRPNAPPS